MKPRRAIAIGLVWKETTLAVGRRAEHQVLAGFDEFPGGKCEDGEDPAEAVVRECWEETGLLVELIGLRLRVEQEIPSAHLDLWFFDLRASGQAALTPPFAWWTVEETLAGNFPPANASVLASIREHPGPIG
jgi:8-oxo-dGTP diphosphatase